MGPGALDPALTADAVFPYLPVAAVHGLWCRPATPAAQFEELERGRIGRARAGKPFPVKAFQELTQEVRLRRTPSQPAADFVDFVTKDFLHFVSFNARPLGGGPNPRLIQCPL